MRVSSGRVHPRHSVVVPTFQRRDSVVASLRALRAQSVAPVEVIVVVDGSTDGTADALRAEAAAPFPVRVVEQPNSGASRARNHGASLAAGELLLFLDDDMLAAPDLLEVLDRAHQDGVDAVLGHIPLAPQSPPSFLARGVAEWAEGRRRRLVDSGGALTTADLLTGQLSVRRDLFLALGGFDEQFTRDGSFGGEDTDFGRRLFDGEHHVVFAPDAVSHQLYTVTPRAYLRQWHQAGAADVGYVRKHPTDLAEVYLAKRPHTRSNRLVVRPLSRVPVLRDVVALGARTGVLAVVRARPDAATAARAFFVVRNLEYWRGVERAGGMPRPRPLRVLCYHAVSDLDGTRLRPYGVPPGLLRAQLRLLDRVGVSYVTPAEAARALLEGGGLPRRPLLVTFDDCYEDLLHEGLAVLGSLRVPAAAFAVADRIGGTNQWDARLGGDPLRLLDAEGLRALERAGLEIGGHGSTHVPLSEVSDDPVVLHHETVGALTRLRSLGLRPSRAFAYPHGAHDPRVRSSVAAAGVRLAFTVTPGWARAGDDPLQVPRIEVVRDDGAGWRLLLKLATAGRLSVPGVRQWPREVRRRLGAWRRRSVRRGQGAHTR